MYEALVKNVEAGHNDTCDTALVESMDITDCTCGYREALKMIAYARGDDAIEVDEGGYKL
jgi:hypothetical protein